MNNCICPSWTREVCGPNTSLLRNKALYLGLFTVYINDITTTLMTDDSFKPGAIDLKTTAFFLTRARSVDFSNHFSRNDNSGNYN